MGFTIYTGKHSTAQASIAEGVDLYRVNATQNLDDKLRSQYGFDHEQPFIPQVKSLAEVCDLTSEEWQTIPLLVVPPALNFIAVTLLAELHGHCGYFLPIVRRHTVLGSLPPRYEVAEVLNLQAVRDGARRETMVNIASRQMREPQRSHPYATLDVKDGGSKMRFEEHKRTSRILELVQMIAVAPQRYLRRDLAERFEVSERMIQKDLEIIRHGLKLQILHSPEGYYFEEMPRLPALQYTFAEALALLLAVQAARQISGVGSTELAAAAARLEALFPPEFTPLLRQAVAQPVVTAQREHRQQMLGLLNRALIEGRKVRMVYETRSRGGATSERVARPYHLMPYVRSWQLIAYCELREAVRMFKVDRVQKATLLDEHYNIPADFDVDAYMERDGARCAEELGSRWTWCCVSGRRRGSG